MRFAIRTIIIPILLLLALPAFGQTIQFSADITQANGVATPTLTWDTTPLALNCDASGDWTGPKGGAGFEVQPTITSSATYNLTCTWPTAVTLSWTPPTENTDGSPLTDLTSYNLYFGTQSGTYPQTVNIGNPGVSTFVLDTLTEGTWFFVLTAVKSTGVESDVSNEATKVVAANDSSESVGVVVNPQAEAPTGLSAD